MKYLRSLCAATCLLFTACTSAKVENYGDHTPAMDIRNYLNGNLEAWGVFIDRSGMANPSFHVNLKGSWQGSTGTLQEHFDYSDGHTQERVWTMHFTDDHHFTATAPDVVGEAKGAQFGNAVHMSYVLALESKGSTHDMSMEDWMYLMDTHTLINRTEMSKFGIHVGEIILTFHKK